MKFIAFVMALAFVGNTAIADDAVLSKLMKNNKCVMCHKVTALKIKSKGKAPDLSHLSADVTGYEKGAKIWIQGWMKKEILKGPKKHAFTWKGTEADLNLIADGLIELNERK
ncbi:MAG: hypothetical protein A2X86_08565 [Bdellovibrionales bacterium GWA2_49_15]|nr:MAG: hypothetical protein A2X86_08565 [Bdellovibrionales bacterium GWA2_49_15]HAZ11185.1 hypothetical protein [Bdellovibrionales bacterium]